MSWEDTVNTYNKQQFSKIANAMRAGDLEPVILRWKKALKGTIDINGFEAVVMDKVEDAHNNVSMVPRINPSFPLTFFPDDLNIGYAILPKTTRNMNVLAAVSTDEEWPAEVLKDQTDLIKEIKAIAAGWAPKQAITKVTGKPGKPKKVEEDDSAAEVTNKLTALIDAV